MKTGVKTHIMHRLHRDALRLAAAVAMLLLLPALPGCRSDREPDSPDLPAAEEGTLQLGFYLNLGDLASGYTERGMTRAPSDGEYDPGAGYENYIDLPGGDYRIYLFNKSNVYIQTVENPEIVPVDGDWTNPFSKRYYLQIKLEKEALETFKTAFATDEGMTTFDFKIVMLANWRDSHYPELASLVSGVTTIDDMVEADNAIINCDDEYTLGDAVLDYEHRIPLYGVSEYTGIKPEPEKAYMLGDLHLLRALAKIEVFASDDSNALEYVTLTRYSCAMRCAPFRTYRKEDYVFGTYSKDYVATPSLPNPAYPNETEYSQTPIDFKYVTDEEGARHYIIYVPEYKNLGRVESEWSRIQIKFVDKKTSDILDFKYYQVPDAMVGIVNEGDHFDVLRNVWYRYEVRYNDLTELEVKIDVQPYSEQWLYPEYGLLRDEDGDLMVIMDEDNRFVPDGFEEKFGDRMPAGLTPDWTLGDYYAIVLGRDGEMKNASVWLKDKEGYRVMSNFSAKDAGDQDCSTREVRKYTPLADRTEAAEEGVDYTVYHKDIFNDVRIYHCTNHWTVAIDNVTGYMIFKSPDGETHYRVESWDENYEWPEGSIYAGRKGLIYVVGTKHYIPYGPDGEMVPEENSLGVPWIEME